MDFRVFFVFEREEKWAESIQAKHRNQGYLLFFGLKGAWGFL